MGFFNRLLDEKEENVGAFTVANLNDTDGDGAIDNGDETVEKGTDGEDEEDLMKLVVKGPTNGRAKVTVVSGSVEFWENSTKKKKVDREGGNIFIAGDKLPKTIWVEATNFSSNLRDIELKLGFETPDGVIVDDLDKVKATAVWAEKTAMKNSNGAGIWSEIDDGYFLSNFAMNGNDFGIIFGATRFSYTIGFEFVVKPDKIAEEPGVMFDISRDIAFKDWNIKGGVVTPVPFVGKDDVFNPGDKTDDDTHNQDEDNTPQVGKNNIYVFDAPGDSVTGTQDQVVSRNNFEEFVRVSFNKVRPFGNNDTGSRCSLNIPWHAFYWLEKDTSTGKYKQRSGKINEVEAGHLDLGAPPSP